MRKRQLAVVAAVLLFVATAAAVVDRSAEALPPAGTDSFPIVLTADVTSRLGDETIVFNGTTDISHGTPFDDGGFEVADLSIDSMDVVGASSIGAITVMEPTSIGVLGPIGQAADTGGDGNGFQSNVGAAFIDDTFTSTGLAAQDIDSGTTTSSSCTDAGKDRHRFYTFETGLPPAAVVEGIDVRLDAWSDLATGAPFMCVELSWDGGTSWTAPKSTTQLATSASSKLVGGANDLWGHAWTLDELSPDNFRIRITNVATDNARDFYLDFVGVRVYYSAPLVGEIRAEQTGDDFPASSYIDLYASVQAPITVNGATTSVVMHNKEPFHLVPMSGGQIVPLTSWPPEGVTYALEPVFNVDNDGDTQVDEDTADDDGDRLHDEDRPGVDPDTPGAGGECGGGTGGPDCDNAEGEDPPAHTCVQFALATCDDDGDGLIDEDPSCIPMYNSANHNTMKIGLCVKNLTLQFPPELPSFSVAPGGPSGYHPADILALTPGGSGGGPVVDPLVLVDCNDDIQIGNLRSTVTFTAQVGETYRIQVGSWSSGAGGDLVVEAFTGAAGSPAPVAVSGNNNLSGAAPIGALPYRGTQDTSAATTEPNEPLNCSMGGRTVWYQYTPGSTQNVTVRTSYDNDGDGLVDEDPVDTVDNDGDTIIDEDPADSNFDTVLSVYTGDGFPSGGGGGETTPPFVRIPCANLGLIADGCDNGGDGDIDDLDALSFGDDLDQDIGSQFNFSVGPGAQGLPGTGVEGQRNCPSPEPEPDEFGSALDGTNTLVLDGNGPVGTCTSAFPLGLVESAGTRDDLDAVHGKDPLVVDPNDDGMPDNPVYFSLAATSPTLGSIGASPASILKTSGGATPTVYASAATLGLQVTDDIDSLCLSESGDGSYVGGEDVVYFSLAPGSPTLGTLGVGPGDILQPGSPVTLSEATDAALGLTATDDVDALKCLSLFVKDPDGDTDGDTIPNSVDADDDNDGCLDVKEIGPNVALGGRRNPHILWDFFDTPVPGTTNKDLAITVGDIFRIVGRFGLNDANGTAPINRNTDPYSAPPMTGYHPAYDRTPSGPYGWNLGPPNGSVSTADILVNVLQFGHSCL